jgi:small-conductance mechanosensitive channel
MDLENLEQTFQDIWNIKLLTVGGNDITISSIVLLIFIIFISFIFSWIAQGVFIRAMTRFRKSERFLGTKKLIHYIILVAGIAVGLQTIGIDLSVLFTAGAIFAVGIGFAMQNIMQNFASGVILLMEQAINPGDILEVDGMLVKVKKVGIRATMARTRDDEDLIIPNSLLVQSTMKNHTLEDTYFRARVDVGVAYESNMRQVREVLENVAAEVQEKGYRDPVVFLRGFGDSAVNWEVSVWTDNPWDEARLKSNLMEGIWFALQENGVVIAFPQVDLHLDKPVEEALLKLAK